MATGVGAAAGPGPTTSGPASWVRLGLGLGTIAPFPTWERSGVTPLNSAGEPLQ